MHAHKGGGGALILGGLHALHGAGCGAGSQNPEIRTRAEIRGSLNRLSHPGAPPKPSFTAQLRKLRPREKCGSGGWGVRFIKHVYSAYQTFEKQTQQKETEMQRCGSRDTKRDLKKNQNPALLCVRRRMWLGDFQSWRPQM